MSPAIVERFLVARIRSDDAAWLLGLHIGRICALMLHGVGRPCIARRSRQYFLVEAVVCWFTLLQGSQAQSSHLGGCLVFLHKKR